MKKIQKNFYIVLFADIALIAVSLYAAYLIRFELDIPGRHWSLFFQVLPVALIIKPALFYFFDLYHGMWRYTSIADLINVIKAAFASTLLIIFLLLLINRFAGYSRSVFIIDLLLTVILISGFRVAVRFYFESITEGMNPREVMKNIAGRLIHVPADQKKLLIIGAGDCGEKMFREIRDNAHLKYKVVGFIDDNPTKIGKKIHGVPVRGSVEELPAVAEKLKADEILIAVPSARGEQMRRIVEHCKKSEIPYKTVPSMGELIDGRVTYSSIRDVAYSDLLGREAVRLDKEKIGAYLYDQCVMVSGAGGSIGSELCRQICRYQPKTLLLFERGENLLYHIEMELRSDFKFTEIVPILADIQDPRQVEKAFSQYLPQTVFHAAAYKHVPMLENQPWTPVKNNILGTANLAEAAKKYGVERFVFVSTDKAVRPANIMGVSKRVAEMLIQNQNGSGHIQTPRFVSVRFGNVVGSEGSVVPLFKKQIERGGPVTVTHPDMTRYFMMIPEACQLILQAGGMGHGGEIFILDMGRPVRILDMARDLIRLSGFEPEKEIGIDFIGLRPGEKLCEELITDDEATLPTSHEKIMVIKSSECDLATLQEKIDALTKAAQAQDAQEIRRIFSEIVPEYRQAEG
ncbi:MAG: polysaccharide biosynthesis protein [Desulfobacteraceae bacterium]|nr:polysaccharide biosynthesis protein [Desulfobacteraceae bacterium]